jgi:hypothetical protein
MRLRYDVPTEEDLCPSVQCAFCEQWMCGCQVQARCSDHFKDPCLVEGEPE